MRRLLIDASVFITLAEIGHADLLETLRGNPLVPAAVADEICDEPAASALDNALDEWLSRDSVALDLEGIGRAIFDEYSELVNEAASHLGVENPIDNWHGDLALLTIALRYEGKSDGVVVITDDKPLRTTCKALAIPISGSIGVVIAAVERGDLDPEEAKDALVAMDEVGAHLSARLLRRAERMIDDTADETD